MARPKATPFKRNSTLADKTEGLFSLKSVFAAHVQYGSKAEYAKDVRDKFLEKLADNPVKLTEAAHFVGVSRRTVEKWIARYEDFAEAIEDIFEEVSDKVEETLFRGAMGEIKLTKEQVTALLGWLNAHRSKQYDPNRLRFVEATSPQPPQVHFHFNLPAPVQPVLLEAPVDAEVIDADA